MKNENTIHLDMDPNVLLALRDTIYPGADNADIDKAISYCKALKLDPMQKPVHLVSMPFKTPEGNWQRRVVPMPGIGLYRIQASRSGIYAGMTEPEFGGDITEQVGNKKITYPKWCKITVKKYLNGIITKFSAKEYWKENYATIGSKEKDISPNLMWEKRPYGQLAKCTEAQALRKAFPELVGSQPTAEEMEGKTFDILKDVTLKDVIPSIEFKFIELDASETEAMKLEQVIIYISNKIQSIQSEEDLEKYKKWKNINQTSLKNFATYNKKDAEDLGSTFKMVEASIKTNTFINEASI